ENVRLFKELQARNTDLTDALARQTATSEILRVISSSPTDLQPVFDAIVQSAGRLCAAEVGGLQLLGGQCFPFDAHYGVSPEDVKIIQEQVFPMGLDRGSGMGRAIITRAVVHIEEVWSDPEFHVSVVQALQGFRTLLAAPMLRGDVPLGVLSLWRREVRPFSRTQIELLQTFADQAVIAIENVRLFTELQSSNGNLTRALDQQTATSEILEVISSSPTDVQPVFDAIVRSASRLCGGEFVIVTRYDGDLLHLAAQYNARPGSANLTERLFPRRLGRDLPSARAILDGAPVHIPDAAEDRDLSPDVVRIARSFLSVPMIREDVPIGAIGVSRAPAEPFAPEQIALLQTFADQAVIAIENVRLFTELQASNRDLTTALDKQTAPSDILRVISRSQTDVQPVFDAILASAVRLLQGYSGVVTRVAGDQLD